MRLPGCVIWVWWNIGFGTQCSSLGDQATGPGYSQAPKQKAPCLGCNVNLVNLEKPCSKPKRLEMTEMTRHG